MVYAGVVGEVLTARAPRADELDGALLVPRAPRTDEVLPLAAAAPARHTAAGEDLITKPSRLVTSGRLYLKYRVVMMQDIFAARR